MKEEIKYQCEFCEKVLKSEKELFYINDMIACANCHSDAIERAEWAYDSAREDGLI